MCVRARARACVCVFVCVLISYIMSTCLPSMQAKTLGNPYKGTNSVCLHQPHVDLNTSLRRVHVVAEKASVGHSCWSDSPCFDQPLGLITTTTITIYFIHPSGKLKIKDQIKDQAHLQRWYCKTSENDPFAKPNTRNSFYCVCQLIYLMARKAELLIYHQVTQKRVDSSRSCTPSSPFWFWLQVVGAGL